MTARLSPLFRLMATLALPAAGLFWGAAHAADDYAQVQRLLGQGQTAQALQQADDYIAKHPGDPQMRFIKTRALQAAGRVDEAEAMLTQLTHDYPELAEPWNNLAVLYAGRGQIDAARTALEAALRIDPHYATALENMGDIDISLALRHYGQARQADAGVSARLSAKIDAARRVVGGSSAPAAQPVASRPEAAASEPAAAASGPEGAATAPAGITLRPVSGDLPVIPMSAPSPQPAASLPEAAASSSEAAASSPEAAASAVQP